MTNGNHQVILVLYSVCASMEQEPRDQRKQNDEKGNRDHDVFPPPLSSLPLWCDVTILPEIPIYNDYDHEDDDSVLVLRQQELNPCGYDNVLWIPRLPRAQTPGYLLSLTSCWTRLFPKKSSVAQNDNDDDDDDEALLVSVYAEPPTFDFLLKSIPWNNDDDDNDDALLYKEEETPIELRVSFDFSKLLEIPWPPTPLPPVSPQTEEEEKEEDWFECPTTINSATTTTTTTATNGSTITDTKQNHEIAKLLHELVQQETNNLDRVLHVLIVICVGVLGWTLYQSICPPAKRKKTKHCRCTPQPIDCYYDKVPCKSSLQATTTDPRMKKHSPPPTLDGTRHNPVNAAIAPAAAANAVLLDSCPSNPRVIQDPRNAVPRFATTTSKPQGDAGANNDANDDAIRRLSLPELVLDPVVAQKAQVPRQQQRQDKPSFVTKRAYKAAQQTLQAAITAQMPKESSPGSRVAPKVHTQTASSSNVINSTTGTLRQEPFNRFQGTRPAANTHETLSPCSQLQKKWEEKRRSKGKRENRPRKLVPPSSSSSSVPTDSVAQDGSFFNDYW